MVQFSYCPELTVMPLRPTRNTFYFPVDIQGLEPLIVLGTLVFFLEKEKKNTHAYGHACLFACVCVMYK